MSTESERSYRGIPVAESQNLIDGVGSVCDPGMHFFPAGGADFDGRIGERIDGGEIEIGEGVPELPPSLRENAGLSDGFDGEEEKNVVENSIGEITETIIAVG